MTRHFDENGLRDALHTALAGTPLKDIPYERIAAAGRRRRMRTVTGGAGAAVVAIVAATFGVAQLSPAQGSGTQVGYAAGSPGVGQSSPSDAAQCAVLRSGPSPKPGGDVLITPEGAVTSQAGCRTPSQAFIDGSPSPGISAWPSGSADPSAWPGAGVPSGSPGEPLPSEPATSFPPGRPTSPSGYCAVHRDTGNVDWPPAADEFKGSENVRWQSPKDGPLLSFPAERVLICRYAMATASSAPKLLGAAEVTDAATVQRLQNAVNAGTVRTDAGCAIDGIAYVGFAGKRGGTWLNVDLTNCDGWVMPYGLSVKDGFADTLRTLTPAGAGNRR